MHVGKWLSFYNPCTPCTCKVLKLLRMSEYTNAIILPESLICEDLSFKNFVITYSHKIRLNFCNFFPKSVLCRKIVRNATEKFLRAHL